MLAKFTIVKNTNSISGTLFLLRKKYFFKLLSPADFKREVNGFNFLKNYYPVAQLQHKVLFSKLFGVMVFVYEDTVEPNKGLLLDGLVSGENIEKELDDILTIYKKVFLKTVALDHGDTADVFFKDRISKRLDVFYSPQFIEEYTHRKLILNGVTVKTNLFEVISNLRVFFNTRSQKYCIASQCDPTDLNIGLKPVFFDYNVGGMNPLMGEFAVFAWQNLFQGGYLSPKYYSKVFKEHDTILSQLDTVAMEGINLTHTLSNVRMNFIHSYIERVLKPVMESVEYPHWYSDFKNYLAMRILAVTNISSMSEADKHVSLAYLAYFYNQDIKTLDELQLALKTVCKIKN